MEYGSGQSSRTECLVWKCRWVGSARVYSAGDLSARVMHIEKSTEQHSTALEHLVEMQDAPITSDHQQFERLKYLEKELDRMRDLIETHLIKE